jgi:hypothetical protein
MEKKFTDADLAFIEVGVTTKSEAIERLGEGLYYEAYNVISYRWATFNKFFWAGVAPAGISPTSAMTYKQLYTLFAQFDSNDRVKRFQRMREPDKGLSVKEWLERE